MMQMLGGGAMPQKAPPTTPTRKGKDFQFPAKGGKK